LRIKVKLFARLRELAATGEVDMEVTSGLTASGLTAMLKEKLPLLGNALDSAAVAVNGENAQSGVTLKAGDEVAFLPPFSGG
jgi:sulfur-carrier protein